MRKFATILLLGCCLATSAQKKKFFDNLDLMLNLHVGETSMEKDGWAKLIGTPSSGYSLDTFYAGSLLEPPCRHCIDIFSSASIGARVAKTLVKGNQKNKVDERLEWRLAAMFGTVSRTRSSFVNYDTASHPLPPGEFTYRKLEYTYRRNCIDINSHLVYKFRDPFFRDEKFNLYFGMGAGLSLNIHGRFRENLFTNRATPAGFNYTITEENYMTSLEKISMQANPYFTVLSGGEFICSDRLSMLFEITTTTAKTSYTSGGYLSTIFRFKL